MLIKLWASLKEVVLQKDSHAVHVPPFDPPDIWEGNATVMRETVDQLNGERQDVVVCSVGGGGLLNGIVQEIDRQGWTDQVEVVAMETKGAKQSVPSRWEVDYSGQGHFASYQSGCC